MRTLTLAAVAAALPAAALAHVVMSPATAAPGGYYAGDLRISHGCEGSATLAVTVMIPPSVASAKPQPKPGWTLEIKREPLPQPVPGEGGQMLRDHAGTITWRGRLPDDQFDTFGLMLKLPADAGPLYFKTVQTCEKGENRWTDIPAPGAAWGSVPHPAPVLTLKPASADPMAGMDHDHHH